MGNMTFEQILNCFIGLLISLVLGFFIGFERKLRFKEAGMRTHSIVCVAAALYTMVSIYGFQSGDPARIAAQIVSGIGFLGAGMVFHHKQLVRGLTTAAGIWATAAVGMAVGVGMWIVAVIATVVIIAVQYVLHLPFKFLQTKRQTIYYVTFRCDDGQEKETVKTLFGIQKFTKFHAEKDEKGIIIKSVVSTSLKLTEDHLQSALKNNPCIISVSIGDEE